MDDDTNSNPPVRIPEDPESAASLALEGDEEEPRVTEEQRRNIARVQAELIGDIPDESA